MKKLVEVLLAIVAILLTTWVFKCLYTWFIIPVFGLPQITFPIALGLIIFWEYLNAKTSDFIKDETFQDKLTKLFTSMIVSLFCLTIGFLLHLAL